MFSKFYGKIDIALSVFAVVLAFIAGAVIGANKPASVTYGHIGNLTITYVDDCAVTSVDRDGYTAKAPAGTCLTGSEITLLPHTR